MMAEKVRRKEACEGSQGRKIRRRRNARGVQSIAGD
jgi:hypothetical protein